jgi:hypothetical protein
MTLDAPIHLVPGSDPGLLATPLQFQELPIVVESEQSRQLARKQRKGLLKHNFEKMKRDAEDLATLAKALQDDLAKSNENVLSLTVVDKAEKIEKLAKRIKNTARGF